MKIECRGVRITDIPGIAEALVIDTDTFYPVQITFDGSNGPADVVWSADAFREFADAINAIRDMLPSKPTPPPRSATEMAERLADVSSEPAPETPESPDKFYDRAWSKDAHFRRSDCHWPADPCVGHVVIAGRPSSWPDCTCESNASTGHKSDCRRAPYAPGGVKP